MQINEKKELNKITVTELVKKADITRSTFYTHYDSIYDVANDYQLETIDLLINDDKILHSKDDILNYFDEIICGDMVGKGKPEPDIYLTAAKHLELFPDECIALEDAPAGILSAYRAGCHPVFIPDLDEGDIDTREIAEYIAGNLSDVIDFIKKEG